jgi:hypothetical protein
MITITARQNRKGALLPRRFSTGNDPTRPHAVLDTHRVVRSPQRDSDSACREWPTGLGASSVAFQTSIQRASPMSSEQSADTSANLARVFDPFRPSVPASRVSIGSATVKLAGKQIRPVSPASPSPSPAARVSPSQYS